MSDVHKVGYEMHVSEEMLAIGEGFEQKGHYVPREWTAEETAAVARAEAAIAEVRSNPYVWISYDGDLVLSPPPREEWVPEETDAEWLARWRASRSGGAR